MTEFHPTRKTSTTTNRVARPSAPTPQRSGSAGRMKELPPAAPKAEALAAPTLARAHRTASSSLGMMTDDQRIIISGYDALRDLIGDKDLGQMLYLFIKRRIPPKPVADLIRSMVIAVNYPEIRVWPIGAVALAGVAGTTGAPALAAGLLGIEGTVLGVFAGEGAYMFLKEADDARKAGRSPATFVQDWLASGKVAFGYGRPLFKTDERVAAVLRIAEQNGLASGSMLRLALEIEGLLTARKGLRMNYAGLMAGLVHDLGFSREEFNSFQYFLPLINFLGVFHEHAHAGQPLFPLSCDDIEYVGPPAGK